MTIIDNLVWIMQGESSQLKSDIDKARKDVDGLKASMDKGDSSASNLFANLKNLAGVLGVSVGAKWIASVTEETALLGAEINRVAGEVGSSSDMVADFASGVNSLGENVESGLSMLVRFNQQIERNEQALNDAGIAARDLNGDYRDAVSILNDVNEAAKEMNAQQRANLFKRLNLDPQLMPANITGNDDIFSARFREQADQYKAASDEGMRIADQIKFKLGEIFLPVLIKGREFFNWLAEAIKDNLYPIITGLGALFIGVFSKAVIPLLGAAITLVKALGMAMLRNPMFIALSLLSIGIGKIWELLNQDTDGTFLAQLQKMFPNIFGLINWAMDLFDDLAKSLDFTDVIDMVMYALGYGFGFMGGLIDGLIGKIKDLINWFAEVGKSVGSAIGGAWDTVKGWFGGGKSSVPSVSSGAAEQNAAMGNNPLNNLSQSQINNNISRDTANTTNKATNVKADITYNMNNNGDPEQVRKVVQEENRRSWNDLATQGATGQER